MSILRYASPQSRYYQADRDILNDYDNRIDLYNTELKQYRTDAGSYQTKVDAFNETVNTYNSDRDAWKQKAEAYNTAVADWNATGRTTPYNEWSGTVATPGEWFATAPVFEGGGAPVAPLAKLMSTRSSNKPTAALSAVVIPQRRRSRS